MTSSAQSPKDHHALAADHHEQAAKHHRNAAKHFDSEAEDDGAREAHLAHGHAQHAITHGHEAAKGHADRQAKTSTSGNTTRRS